MSISRNELKESVTLLYNFMQNSYWKGHENSKLSKHESDHRSHKLTQLSKLNGSFEIFSECKKLFDAEYDSVKKTPNHRDPRGATHKAIMENGFCNYTLSGELSLAMSSLRVEAKALTSGRANKA